MKKLSSAIIGCGAIFPMHAASILNNKNTTLVAVCDTNEERAKNKAEQCKCDFYTDYKAMIEAVKPDVVHICLPHYLHAPVSMYARRSGINKSVSASSRIYGLFSLRERSWKTVLKSIN